MTNNKRAPTGQLSGYQIKYVTSPLSLDQWPRNFARWCWLTVRILTYKVTWPLTHVAKLGQVTNYKNYITTATMFIVTKVGRVVTYYGGIRPITSNASFIIWPIKNVTSPLPQWMWLSNLAVCWHRRASTHRVIRSVNHVV